MSEHKLHTIMRCFLFELIVYTKIWCLVSELMLHTNMCNVHFRLLFQMINCIWQSLFLDLVNINVYAKFYQNIPKGSRDRTSSTFFRIWTSAKARPITNGIWQSLGLDLVNINVYAKFHHNIPLGRRDRTIFTFSEFGATSAKLRMINVILQSLGLELLHINVYEKFIKIFKTV